MRVGRAGGPRGLVAARDIPAGQIILAVPPWLHIFFQGSPEEGAVILLALKYGDDAAELAPWLASLPQSGLAWGALTHEQAAQLQCPELVRRASACSDAFVFSQCWEGCVG